MSRLAYESGIEVIAPDFRRLPEHGYPAQLEDALAVFHGLQEEQISAEEIVVIGDSSGGNLAAELALELRNRGLPQPRALGLISPWCDLEMPGQSFLENDRYDFGTRDVLVKHARAFAGEHDLADPRISPINADLSGLCPCLVIVGELELPQDDILRFHEKLATAGVSTELHVASMMPHAPPAFAALQPEGEASAHKLAAYVVAQLSGEK
jgi:acetyl esterase/lipase